MARTNFGITCGDGSTNLAHEVRLRGCPAQKIKWDYNRYRQVRMQYQQVLVTRDDTGSHSVNGQFKKLIVLSITAICNHTINIDNRCFQAILIDEQVGFKGSQVTGKLRSM